MIVYANQFLDPSGRIVESATMLAEHVVPLLNPGKPIEISFAGLRGISSSYFNVLLRRIADTGGIDSIDALIRPSFNSDVQRRIYQRSLDVLKQSAIS